VFDTNIVVVGNVLAAPEWRRITSSNSLVANFRVASTARRFDRETNRWIDGNSFRVRVTAWRRLAEGVAASITVGDPVMVYGRLYTRDWQDENGNKRVSYEMEAYSIGHDLARGRAKFFRGKAGQGTSEIETAEAESFVRGEQSVPLTADEAPVGYGDGMPEPPAGEEEPAFEDVLAGVGSAVPGASGAAKAPTADETPAADEAPAAEPADPDEELALEVERLAAEQPAGVRRNRRGGARREPVAA
jgi:single-strand DNA-binding protein